MSAPPASSNTTSENKDNNHDISNWLKPTPAIAEPLSKTPSTQSHASHTPFFFHPSQPQVIAPLVVMPNPTPIAVTPRKPHLPANRDAAKQAEMYALAAFDPGREVVDRFPCQIQACGKVFERRYNLKVHMRKHTKETPYICTVNGCAKKFKWRSSMAHHNKSHERNGIIIDNPRIAQTRLTPRIPRCPPLPPSSPLTASPAESSTNSDIPNAHVVPVINSPARSAGSSSAAVGSERNVDVMVESIATQNSTSSNFVHSDKDTVSAICPPARNISALPERFVRQNINYSTLPMSAQSEPLPESIELSSHVRSSTADVGAFSYPATEQTPFVIQHMDSLFSPMMEMAPRSEPLGAHERDLLFREFFSSPDDATDGNEPAF